MYKRDRIQGDATHLFQLCNTYIHPLSIIYTCTQYKSVTPTKLSQLFSMNIKLSKEQNVLNLFTQYQPFTFQNIKFNSSFIIYGVWDIYTKLMYALAASTFNIMLTTIWPISQWVTFGCQEVSCKYWIFNSVNNKFALFS